MNELQFAKMQGLGNDFVVIDSLKQGLELSTAQLRALADRHFGIGCDQVLLLEPPTSAAADLRYRIYNADGTEAEQCGNGARCVAKFAYSQGLVKRSNITLESRAGLVNAVLEPDGQVTVTMGQPQFNPKALPFLVPSEQRSYMLQAAGQKLDCGAVSIGNPHCVVPVPNISDELVSTLGPVLEKHELFPQHVNVGFMNVISRNRLQLRVYERGAGETMACGTGACAAVAVGIRWGLLDREERISVALPGGVLGISWPSPEQPLFLTGPAVHVFSGSIAML